MQVVVYILFHQTHRSIIFETNILKYRITLLLHLKAGCFFVLYSVLCVALTIINDSKKKQDKTPRTKRPGQNPLDKTTLPKPPKQKSLRRKKNPHKTSRQNPLAKTTPDKPLGQTPQEKTLTDKPNPPPQDKTPPDKNPQDKTPR